jgi:hypothetical protein
MTSFFEDSKKLIDLVSGSLGPQVDQIIICIHTSNETMFKSYIDREDSLTSDDAMMFMTQLMAYWLVTMEKLGSAETRNQQRMMEQIASKQKTRIYPKFPTQEEDDRIRSEKLEEIEKEKKTKAGGNQRTSMVETEGTQISPDRYKEEPKTGQKKVSENTTDHPRIVHKTQSHPDFNPQYQTSMLDLDAVHSTSRPQLGDDYRFHNTTQTAKEGCVLL